MKTRRTVTIVDPLETLIAREGAFGRAHRQKEAYGFVEAAGGSIELSGLVGGGGFSRSVVAGLEERGLVAITDEEEFRDPFADTDVGPPPDLTPTPDQQSALDALVGALDLDNPTPFVLQGITGSGKTLVYIELLREVLARGKSAIVLVPEIASRHRRFRGFAPTSPTRSLFCTAASRTASATTHGAGSEAVSVASPSVPGQHSSRRSRIWVRLSSTKNTMAVTSRGRRPGTTPGTSPSSARRPMGRSACSEVRLPLWRAGTMPVQAASSGFCSPSGWAAVRCRRFTSSISARSGRRRKRRGR